MQHCCASCGSLLLTPHRASPCRHPICALCYEAGGCYWRECLCCSGAVTGWDADHTLAEVMAARMAANKPAAVVARVAASWSKRLQAAQAETAGTVRVLFEWGWDVTPHLSGERRSVFLRSATAAHTTGTGGVRAGQEVCGLRAERSEAGFLTYDYSLRHIRLQPLSHMLAGARPHGQAH